MDVLHKQVAALQEKVDAVYQILEGLNCRVADALAEQQLNANHHVNDSQNGLRLERHSYNGHSYLNTMMEHKDVLADKNYFGNEEQTGEKALAPEIQIQRLTAQLTAAYNRIAALEEQLLAKRVH